MSVYNNESTVGNSIESTLNQTYKFFEFIIVDDCSYDSSFQIIEEYAKLDSRIKIIKNKENIGLAASLNNAINRASGKYIARMDADDEMLSSRLKLQVDYLNNNQDVGVLGGGAYVLSGGNMTNKLLMPCTHQEIKKTLPFRNPIIHPSVMIRRNLLLENKYKTNLRRKQDYELWGRLINVTKFHNLGEPLIKYHFNEKGVDSVYADLVYVKPENLDKVVRYYDSGQFNPKKFAYGWMPAHPTFFVKRTIYEKYGVFKTDYKIAADYELLIRFLAIYEISYSYLSEPIIKMRMGGASTSGLGSNYILNKEIIRACRENGIYTNWLMVLSKYPKKLLGLLKK